MHECSLFVISYHIAKYHEDMEVVRASVASYHFAIPPRHGGGTCQRGVTIQMLSINGIDMSKVMLYLVFAKQMKRTNQIYT